MTIPTAIVDRGRIDLTRLRQHRRILAVVAHPDDESFGLGALLVFFKGSGYTTALLCFTHGEASTLHGVPGELLAVRARELRAATLVLGSHPVRLLDYSDGKLGDADLDTLREHVSAMIEQVDADLLLTFDEGGITGHRDHVGATEAATAAARMKQIPVVAWALPLDIALTLNREFGTSFSGRPPSQIDLALSVDRVAQRKAIACHRSQANDNPVLWRRLALLGNTESLRLLKRDRGDSPAPGV